MKSRAGTFPPPPPPLFFLTTLPSTSLSGVYSETFIHRCDISLAHAFIDLFRITMLVRYTSAPVHIIFVFVNDNYNACDRFLLLLLLLLLFLSVCATVIETVPPFSTIVSDLQ